MAKIIGLPKLSPTMEEGTLVSWTKKEGESVEVDDLLAEVETDKATMEFRSFDKGVLLKILVPEGETLEPDTPVAIIGDEGEDIGELLEKLESGAADADTDTDTDTDTGTDTDTDANTGTDTGANTGTDTDANTGTDTDTGADTGTRILSSPLVRRLARERDIDLRDVEGSGPRGRIIKRDIEGFEKAPASPEGVSGKRRPPKAVKASSMRRTIARRLTESTQTIPHYYLTIDVDIGPLMDARKAMNSELEEEGEKVSLNDVIIKATAMALRRHPEINVSWTDKEVLYHQVVDISVAVAVEDGLMTPVVRDADRKGVAQIAKEVRDLAERARDRKLAPEEMTNGTFSISNLGMFGIEEFTAVINPPESAILAVGTIRREPIIEEEELSVGRRMRFTMSCDHRAIDGATGAKFLATLKRTLESPLTMLL